MNIQNIIVALIVLSALLYVGSIFLRKVKSFSTKSSCGSDCGCDAGSKKVNDFVNIARK